MTSPPIAVALDTDNPQTARQWAAAAGPFVSTIKIGLELYLRCGADAVDTIRDASGGCDLFLDLKLHDIPHTVAGAARSVAPLRADYLTVHAAGGAAMIRAAVDQLPGTRITGVTLLTSLGAADVAAGGWRGTAHDVVRRLATLAVTAGARAIVCSPAEVAALRREVGPEVTLITPGVRPLESEQGDQARVATPESALADGADLLVIGRPITRAPDVALAAREIAESLLTQHEC